MKRYLEVINANKKQTKS